MTPKEVKKKSGLLNLVYKDYKEKLLSLQKKHCEEVNQLLRESEKRKIEEVRKKLL